MVATPVVLVAMFGCAPTLTREVGQLNLHYTPAEQPGVRSEKVVAVVSPEIAKFEGVHGQNYQERVKEAIGTGVQELLTKKGFNLVGPFSNFDDMAYGEKKKAYIALVPVLNLVIDQKITKQDTTHFTHIRTIEGVVSVGGELVINLIEPLTKERIMSKRINLSDLKISENFIRQAKVGSSGMLFDAIASTNDLTDNSDKALSEAVNKFYTGAMAKIDRMISVEEIESFNASVQELKGMKRF
jgi:neuraminyllactose-binding hemagglutinin